MTTKYLTDALDHDGKFIKDALLQNVHDTSQCSGRACTVHNPSDHHMRTWPTVWNSAFSQMDRQCEHGILHPDPDDLAYRKQVGRDYGLGDHEYDCDGCCSVVQ